MIISLDTETTGLDFQHGAKPYLVTISRETGDTVWWEWDVDPTTRQPVVPEGDLAEIAQEIQSADRLVFQNPRFDLAALREVGLTKHIKRWPWEKIYDTLLAGHLLASNQPHDLTTMSLVYLKLNLSPYEESLKKCVDEARRMVRNIPGWRIAKRGLPEMPSAKDKVWKFDTWLPRAIAQHKPYPKNHLWHQVASTYANSDSAATLMLFERMKQLLEERGLWRIYEERLKVLPIVYDMEERGITINGQRTHELTSQYQEGSAKYGRMCCNIAKGFGYDLQLPKGGVNKSLTKFVFGPLGLEPLKRNKKTEEPSLDKETLEQYEASLPEKSKALLFVRSLRYKRKQDTAVTYMDGYQRFWRRLDDDWYVLYPFLNATGTDTLRWSSSNPNEQNISKQDGFNLRYCFGPAPGREWWSLDAQNLELRIPAYESGERELIDLFEHPDDPPYYGGVHLLNFHTVYPDIWQRELDAVGFDKVGPHCKKKYAGSWYQWCKNGGFAVQYGAVEESGTADRAFHRVGSHARLKSRFNKLSQLNQHWVHMANRLGYVETTPDKSVDPNRGYPLLCSRSQWGGILPTVPLNYHVQGTAMWWMMKAMIRCYGHLQEYNETRKPEAQVHIVMQIHDELVFDMPKKLDPREVTERRGLRYLRTNLPVVAKLKSLMEKGGDDIGVPTPVSCEYHPSNWSEGGVISVAS